MWHSSILPLSLSTGPTIQHAKHPFHYVSFALRISACRLTRNNARVSRVDQLIRARYISDVIDDCARFEGTKRSPLHQREEEAHQHAADRDVE